MVAPTIIGTNLEFVSSNPNTSSAVNAGSVTPAAGSNRKIFVFVGYEKGSSDPSFTVEWGSGNSLTKRNDISTGTTAFNGVEVFELLDTDFPVSAEDILVDPNILHDNNLSVITIQVQDADQVQAIDEATATDTNSYSLSVTDSESLVLQSLTSGGSADYSVDSPATEVANADSASDLAFSVGKIDDQASGSVTLNATGTDTTRRAHAAIAVPPSSPGASNNPPVAVDDSFTGVKNQDITGNVLSNDTDADLDTLTVTANTDPSDGSVTVASNGDFTYTPDADFVGSDSFDYTVSDGTDTDTGTVNLTINDQEVVVILRKVLTNPFDLEGIVV